MPVPPDSPSQHSGDLRVAYVTMLFPARSETFASQDVRELRRMGVDITVHSMRPRNGEEARLASERELDDVPCTYNGFRASLRGAGIMLARPWRSLAVTAWLLPRLSARPRELLKTLTLLPRAFEVFARLERQPPHVVHVYWGHYPALIGHLVQRYLPGTVVSMSLGAYDLEARYPLTAPVASAACFVRTHGECNVPVLIERVGVARERVAVIYNGVALSRLPDRPLDADRVPGRIVTAARLVASKGVDDVLRAFAQIRERLPGATLEIFGDGPDVERLTGIAGDLGIRGAVSFRGHVSHDRIFESLTRAELLLFLSRDPTDRLPNVVKEAMGCGAACVVSDTTGIDELIAGPEYGRVVPKGDPDAAARAALELLERPDTMRAVRARAHAFLLEHFDLRRTTREYVRRWNAAVTEGGAPPPSPGAPTVASRSKEAA